MKRSLAAVHTSSDAGSPLEESVFEVREMTATSAASIPSSAVGLDASSRRVVGLDSIRFICAFVVVIFHVGLTPDTPHGASLHGLAKLAVGIYNTLFNGPAAVIVFFIISGFCIHFPYKGKRSLLILPFYARRFLRIIPPAGAFCLMIWLAFHGHSSTEEGGTWGVIWSVLWSVVCETIYYLIYPLLLLLRRQSNWTTMLTGSGVLAGGFIASHVASLSNGLYGYIALGWATWIIGLPCWLLGCWLAENYHRFPVHSRGLMWVARSAIYLLSVLLLMFRYHVNSVWASNCISLDLFAIPACLWVGMEIAYGSKHIPNKNLEWAGAWSYSLYLVHPVAVPALAAIGLGFIDRGHYAHLLLIPIVLISSYGFFLLIERPSHRIALAAGRAADSKASWLSVTAVMKP